MDEKLLECLTNFDRLALLFQVLDEGQTTAKMLAAKNKNIPQATLYRHLKKMVADGILHVVEERQVRNVTEKVYAAALDFRAETQKLLEENDGAAYFALFQHFTIGLLKKFSAYGDREDIDIINDGSGFRVATFDATLEELGALSAGIWKLVEPYTNREATPERRTRSISVIFTPPEEKN